MTNGELPLILRRRRVTTFRGRGAIYNWLRAQRQAIAPLLEQGMATWPALCAEMARHGVADRDGKAPSPNAAVRVWQRVCRDLEESAAAEAAKPRRVGAIPPSRMPKDWKPAELRQPAAGRPEVAALPTPTPTGVPALAAPPRLPAALAADPMSKEARLALVPPGMPEWTAPQGDFVQPGMSPEMQAKMLRLEAQARQIDRHFGPPIKRRED